MKPMQTVVETRFDQPLVPPWRITESGKGKVTQLPGALRLELPASPASIYSNAQLTDYTTSHDFAWRPPVRMTVRARAETAGTLVGTAGFGLWNHPYVLAERRFRLPQAVWFFFSSPPSNMQLAKGVPGPGWKAATFDARRWSFLALAPTAPIGLLLMRIPALYKRLWPIGQRAIGVSERLLDAHLLTETHTYMLDWQPDGVTFSVDGETVHRATAAPRRALGFVAWLDNQYAVVTPQGQFGSGFVAVPAKQALVLEKIRIESR